MCETTESSRPLPLLTKQEMVTRSSSSPDDMFGDRSWGFLPPSLPACVCVKGNVENPCTFQTGKMGTHPCSLHYCDVTFAKSSPKLNVPIFSFSLVRVHHWFQLLKKYVKGKYLRYKRNGPFSKDIQTRQRTRSWICPWKMLLSTPGCCSCPRAILFWTEKCSTSAGPAPNLSLSIESFIKKSFSLTDTHAQEHKRTCWIIHGVEIP